VLLVLDFGAAHCTAPLQLAPGGRLGTQGTPGSHPACLGVQLEGLGTQFVNFIEFACVKAGLARSRLHQMGPAQPLKIALFNGFQVLCSECAGVAWFANGRISHRDFGD